MKNLLLIFCLLGTGSALAQDAAEIPPPPPEETALEAAPPPPETAAQGTEAQPPAQEPEAAPAPDAAKADKAKDGDNDGLADGKITDMSAASGINLAELIKPIEYNKEERGRDPFRLPDIPLEPLSPGPVFGPFSQMQEVPLDQIQVKGIILHPTSSKAIVAFKPPGADKEKTVVVRVGDPLGENFGRVQAIRDGKVIILQTLEENGALRTTTHVLSIRRYNLKQ
jgi:Tfp pilus assembly protein PilP